MAKPKSNKKPRLGMSNSKSPTSKKIAQKQTNRKVRGEGKKSAKMNEAADIANFITAISSKKYAQANKYLKGIITDKIQSRIKRSLNEPLFTI